MNVTPAQVRNSVNARYVLWGGEMIVRVIQHTGVHGFHSAAVVIDRMDGPIEVRSWNGYKAEYAGVSQKALKPMLEWVAEQLTGLSKGDVGECSIVGLLGFAPMAADRPCKEVA